MEYTAWENLKWIASTWFLWWAYKLLPENSPEQIELLAFIKQHTQKSIDRQEKAKL
jgi:hypothetical protein